MKLSTLLILLVTTTCLTEQTAPLLCAIGLVLLLVFHPSWFLLLTAAVAYAWLRYAFNKSRRR